VLAQNAYITNFGDNTVSVIDTTTNTVVATIPVGRTPTGVAVTPDGSKVYVTNQDFSMGPAGTVSVISTAPNTVLTTIPPVRPGPGAQPFGVAVTPDGTKVYVSYNSNGFHVVKVFDTATNTAVATVTAGIGLGVAVTPDGSKVYVADIDGFVSVIDATTNTVVATITVGPRIASQTMGVAVTPDGTKVYVANSGTNTVSVIDTTTDTVVATTSVDVGPAGLAVTPDGSKVYVANGVNKVSVIATATNTVMGAPITVGNRPMAFGLFIQPATSVFSAFTAKLTVSSFQPKFTLHSNFTLGSKSNGINPQFEAVTLKIGTFAVTIPPGSFTLTAPGTYSFIGVISGLTINAKITHTGGKSYTFDATANANLSRMKSPATVTLTIGNDTGTTTARF
jgi:YVTN family beta-propeller protein